MTPPSPLAPRRLLWLVAFLFAAAIFTWSAWRWWTFQYSTFDLAFYVQGFWLALRGEWQTSLLGVSILGNHAEPTIFLGLPLFALWPHPLFFVLAQVLALVSLPFTAWRIARRLGFESWPSAWLALATLITPATSWVALHEFHPEALAAPLLLLVAEARLTQRYGRFWLWWLLALGIKENVALLLAWWTAVEAFIGWRERWDTRRQLRWNWFPGLVAFAWVAFYGAWLAPRLNGGRVDYGELYRHLTGPSGGLLSTILFHPGRVFQAIVRSLTLGDLLWGLLLPFLALPVLRARWLLIAVPILLQHLLSVRPAEWFLRWHYAAPLIPLFWLAAVEALRLPRLRRIPAWTLAAGSVAGFLWFGPLRLLPQELDLFAQRLAEHPWRAAQIAAIQNDARASVTASHGYLPHLATRRELYSLHHVLKGLVTLSEQRLPTPAATDYVIIDYADNSTFSPQAGFYHPAMKTTTGELVPSSDQLLHTFLAQAEWENDSLNAVTRLHRLGPAAPSSLESPSPDQTPAAALTPGPVQIAIGSEGIDLDLDWQFAVPRTEFRWLFLTASGPAGAAQIYRGLARPEVTGGHTTERWKVRFPPDLPPGHYRLRLLISDRLRAEWDRQNPNGLLGYTDQIIPLGEVQLPPKP